MKPAGPIQFIGVAVVAILLWLVSFGFTNQSFSLDIPVEITGLSGELAVNDPITTIQVTVRAKSINSKRVKSSGNVEATLDLSAVRGIGKHTANVKIISNLEDAEIVDYHPQSLNLTIVPRDTQTIELVPDLLGFPAAGHSLDEVSITPASVEISGPSPLVANSSVAMVPVDISGRRRSFTTVGYPRLTNAFNEPLANVSFSPSTVSVQVNIVSEEGFKTVGIEPTFAGELAGGYWISVVNFDPPAVTLRGNPRDLDNIDRLKSTAINIDGKSSSFRDKVSVNVPTGIQLMGPNLINVRVDVSTASHNRKLVLLPTYTDITEGLSVTSVSPPTVTVILAGPPDLLSTLNRANTSLDLDLRGAISGSNTIDLSQEMFSAPDGVEVVSFDPASLSVSLTKVSE